MKPVRLGIIGCGVIGNHHLEAANDSPLAELVAAADLIEERVGAAAEKYGVTAYPNDEELLKDERIEAVVLAMPTGDRTPVAFKALDAGMHVLLEKPVAGRAEDVEKMIAMRGDRVVACCSPRMAFTGHALAAAECAASGVLGDIRMVRIRAVLPAGPEPNPDPPPWRESMARNGGGILVNWSCYDLDYLMQILAWRLKPRTVLARWWRPGEKMSAYVAPGSDADAHYVALILCEDDITLSMERAEFSSATADQAWEIIGTEASLHMPMRPQEGKPTTVVLDRFVPGEGVVSDTLWKEGDPDPADNVLDDFLRTIREGGEPKTGLEHALVMQRITDAIYASAQSATSVSVPQ